MNALCLICGRVVFYIWMSRVTYIQEWTKKSHFGDEATQGLLCTLTKIQIEVMRIFYFSKKNLPKHSNILMSYRCHRHHLWHVGRIFCLKQRNPCELVESSSIVLIESPLTLSTYFSPLSPSFPSPFPTPSLFFRFPPLAPNLVGLQRFYGVETICRQYMFRTIC